MFAHSSSPHALHVARSLAERASLVRIRAVLLAPILVAPLALTAHATAAPIPIVNAGFEANFAAPNSFPVLVPTGWTLLDPAGIIDQTLDAVGVLNPSGGTFFTPPQAPEGNNVALIYLSGDVGGGQVGLAQQLNAFLTAGQRYTLTVEVGDIDSGFGAPPFDTTFFNLEGFPGYRVQLLAGGQVVAQDDDTLSNVIQDGQFLLSTVTLDVLPDHPQLGGRLEIRLINLNRAGTPAAPGIEVDFDDVRLDASPIPTFCVGDADGNGAVNFDDITSALANFGTDYSPDTGAGDADGNGSVNFDDLTTVLANFGNACN
jgi:hypothetical protein